MSEEILRIFLDDIKVIRVTCRSCETTFESSFDRLVIPFERPECPCCKKPLFPVAVGKTQKNPLADLCDALGAISKATATVKVEFPIKLGA